ncbi:MAG: hypothetical protein H6732_07150 [Alphaproteobacteria bacterium]|nr:hypothetical protein [Alphaproteobacteria bacterium]
MTPVRTWKLVVPVTVLAAFAACGGGETPAPAPEAPAAEEAPAAPDLPAQLEVEAGGDVGGQYAKVPSPGELQVALERAGIDRKLGELVPDRTFQLSESDADRVAVRTGVVIADVLLTLKTSDDAKLLAQLAHIKEGMITLEGGKDIVATVDDLVMRIQADAVTRDALLSELDDLAQVAIPELEFNGKARIVPLIQAGSWLSGANLVAKAAAASSTPGAATPILKQPDVVSYFKGYAKEKEQAEGVVPSMVATALDNSLDQLMAVSQHEGDLGTAELDTVIASTEAVLGLL